MADNAGKELTMKTLISKLGLIAAAGLMATTIATTASAQDRNLMRVNIPFAFLAGERTLPAGDYLFRLDPQFGLVDIHPMGNNAIYRVQLRGGFVSRQSSGHEGGLLTFAKYGSRLALRGVWANGEHEGHEVKTSKAEIELARATGGVPAESVTIR